MKTIKVYCGETAQSMCREQRHPVNEVKSADHLVKSPVDIETYSNSTDFIQACYYIAKREGVEAEFFLNGVSQGNDIQNIFEDFNRSFDLMNELGATARD